MGQYYEWRVLTESTDDPAYLQVVEGTNIYGSRNSCEAPIDAYLMVSWMPFPCGAGGSVILKNSSNVPYRLRFAECPSQPTDNTTYLPYEHAVFPYFPKADANWWAGMAVTNTTYFYETIMWNGLTQTYNSATNTYEGNLSFNQWNDWDNTILELIDFNGITTDQDINLRFYLIEEDGAVYTYTAGTLPKRGIVTTLLSSASFVPTLALGTDTKFGDERFWVVAEGVGTVEETTIALDGFGMLGDGTQAQGYLPRIHNGVYAPMGWTWRNYNKK
jgi:hypothetical protein